MDSTETMAKDPKRTPTLATIAASAGCSTSTVSRALRKSHLLPADTIRRIQRVAAKAGYRANPLVSEMMRRMRGLGRSSSGGTLAYLVFGPTPTAWREHLTYVGFFEGAQARAGELGYRLEAFWADEPGLSLRRLTQILRARGIGGVVVGPTPGLPESPRLDWQHFAATKIGVPYPDLPIPCAVSNHYRAMVQVIAKLESMGYRRLGIVLQEHQNIKTSGLWLAPLVMHHPKIAAADRVEPLILRGWKEGDFVAWIRSQRPDVVIGLRSELVSWLERMGLRVPQEVGFFHLDRCTEPGNFAGLDQRPRETGAAAVDLLAQLLLAGERNLPLHLKELLVEAVWVDGPTLRSRPLRVQA